MAFNLSSIHRFKIREQAALYDSLKIIHMFIEKLVKLAQTPPLPPPPPPLLPPSHSTLTDKFLQGFKTGDLNDLYLPLLTHCFSFPVNVKHRGVLLPLCWLEIHLCWIPLLWSVVWVMFYHLLIVNWISANFKQTWVWLCWYPACMTMVFDHP